MTVEAARGAGLANVSVDLVLGWPGETTDEWGAGLREAEAAGLVETSGDNLMLSPRGVLLSNEVFRLFV